MQLTISLLFLIISYSYSPVPTPATPIHNPQQVSPIRVDEVDNVVDARSPSTPHCGPIEGKMLKGSDGRLYALEMMRLTPRDANYVQVRVTWCIFYCLWHELCTWV